MYYDQKECGVRIAKLRYEMHLSQSEVTDLVHISIDQLRSIETGRRSASIDLLVEFAMLFDVSLDYLILGRVLHADSTYIRKELNEAIDTLTALKQSL